MPAVLFRHRMPTGAVTRYAKLLDSGLTPDATSHKSASIWRDTPSKTTRKTSPPRVGLLQAPVLTDAGLW